MAYLVAAYRVDVVTTTSVVSELMRNVREVKDVIASVEPATVTDAERAALRVLLDELTELIATAHRLE